MVRKSYSAARFTHISSGRKPSAQPGERPASARWKTGLRSAPSRLPRELYASVMHISETEKFEVCLIAREQSLSARSTPLREKEFYLSLKKTRRMSAMRSWKSLVVLLSIAVVSFTFIANVHASVSDQKTIVTFNQPVDIPGKVLTPGTYVFKLLDAAGSRDVVQVLDKNETKVIATFIALPTEMSKPPDKPFIRYNELQPGAPAAIEARL